MSTYPERTRAVPSAFQRLDKFVERVVPRITRNHTKPPLTEDRVVKPAKKPLFLDSQIISMVDDARRMTKRPGRVSKEVLGATLARLKMVEHALKIGEIKAPPVLVGAITQLAYERGEVSNLTYGNVILDNETSFAPMRTLHGGEVGKSEEFFYRVHASIEKDMHAVIAQVYGMIHSLENGNVDEAITKSAGMDERLQHALATEKDLLDNLNTTHYAHVFRNAFRSPRTMMINGNAEPDFEGASGAYSATVPALDYLLRASIIPDRYRRGHEDRMRYYPPQDQPLLIATKNNKNAGRSLSYLYQQLGKPEALVPVLESLYKFFNDFRERHQQMVEKHLQVPLGNDFAGTAKGVGAVKYLESIRNDGIELKPWLTKEEIEAERIRK